MSKHKRATRRAERARLLKKCRALAERWLRATANPVAIERLTRRLLHTRTPCSCVLCGNPRRHFRSRRDRLTLQERRAQGPARDEP